MIEPAAEQRPGRLRSFGIHALLIPLAVALLVAMFVATSVPGWSTLMVVTVVLGWVALGLGWFLAYVTAYLDEEHDPRRRSIAPWLIVPAIALAGAALVMLDIPLRTRFELSRPAMESVVQSGTGSIDTTAGPVRVGLYDIDFDFVDNRIWFGVDDGGFFQSYGFVHAEPGDLATPPDRCASIDPDWWVCSDGGSD
jgi:hypothetical protein